MGEKTPSVANPPGPTGAPLSAGRQCLHIFQTLRHFRWSVVNEEGRAFGDGAGWHQDESGARQEALMTLRLLLSARLPGTDLEVSRYLATLTQDERWAIVDNAAPESAVDVSDRDDPSVLASSEG